MGWNQFGTSLPCDAAIRHCSPGLSLPLWQAAPGVGPQPVPFCPQQQSAVVSIRRHRHQDFQIRRLTRERPIRSAARPVWKASSRRPNLANLLSDDPPAKEPSFAAQSTVAFAFNAIPSLPMDLLERLTRPGPKRILALDGGGVRGLISLGFLARIEHGLRERHQRPDLKLCDYFDLIGGTSTGAIIASALAIGLDVADITHRFLHLARHVFGKTRWKRWETWYETQPLEEELRQVFGERRLDDPSIRAGLCIVTKRADTGNTWPLLNHPHGKFFQGNRSILMRQALRASTAAPTYFVPETLDVGAGEIGAFIDGGVSLANNPALHLFLVATLQGFPFRWPVGADHLLLVSVGTGDWKWSSQAPVALQQRAAAGEIGRGLLTLWHWAKQIPFMLQDDGNKQAQLILQYLSRSATPSFIDGEVGDLSLDLLTPEPTLTYLRYNVRLESDALSRLGCPDLIPRLASLREMSAASNVEPLTLVGERAALDQVRDNHFPRAFDLVPA